MSETSVLSIPAAMNREDRDDPTSPVIGYMCLTDFRCELGGAPGGNTIYSDIEECIEHHKCTKHCGIVEVEVRARRVVQEPSKD